MLSDRLKKRRLARYLRGPLHADEWSDDIILDACRGSMLRAGVELHLAVRDFVCGARQQFRHGLFRAWLVWTWIRGTA